MVHHTSIRHATDQKTKSLRYVETMLWRPRPTPDYKQTPWIDGRERADIQKLLVTNPPTIHRGRIINEATRCQIGRILQTNMRPSRRA